MVFSDFVHDASEAAGCNQDAEEVKHVRTKKVLCDVTQVLLVPDPEAVGIVEQDAEELITQILDAQLQRQDLAEKSLDWKLLLRSTGFNTSTLKPQLYGRTRLVLFEQQLEQNILVIPHAGNHLIPAEYRNLKHVERVFKLLPIQVGAKQRLL